MTLTPCSDLSAAGWLTTADAPWQRLVEFGPPGFPAYARLRFRPDPAHPGQAENDVEFDEDAPQERVQLQAALRALGGHTRTPDDCYVCVWDGWALDLVGADGTWLPRPAQAEDLLLPANVRHEDPAFPASADPPRPGLAPGFRHSRPAAPKVVLPHRAYLFLRGTLSDLGDWGAAKEGPGAAMPDPAFVWPADQAWCLANDVDPHWAGIGATATAIAELLADPGLDVVPADPRADQPRYR